MFQTPCKLDYGPIICNFIHAFHEKAWALSSKSKALGDNSLDPFVSFLPPLMLMKFIIKCHATSLRNSNSIRAGWAFWRWYCKYQCSLAYSYNCLHLLTKIRTITWHFIYYHYTTDFDKKILKLPDLKGNRCKIIKMLPSTLVCLFHSGSSSAGFIRFPHVSYKGCFWVCA